MAKLSIQDLKKIKERERSKMVLRDGGQRARITVHMGTCGIASGARDIMSAFRDKIAEKGVDDVILTNSGCAGLCAQEPMATVEIIDQTPVKYVKLDKDKVDRIFQEHVMGGEVVEDYALAQGSETVAT
jgi:NADP-reducing hydrogenase subunit HndB